MVVETLKVLAIMYVPRGLWAFAGSERFFMNVSQRLKTYGVEIDTIEPKPGLSEQFRVGYNSIEIKIPFLSMVYVSLFAWLLLGLIKSIRLHSKNNYDLVLATNNNIFNFGLGYIVSRILRRPLVVLVHHLRWVNPCDPTSDSNLRLFLTYKKMRRDKLGRLDAFAQTLGAIVESKVYKANLCTVLSEAVMKNLRALGCKNEVVVTGNAIDFDYINSFPTDKKRYDAIFVGRFDEGKGIRDLIEAWKQVTKTFPDVKLVMIGTGILHEAALHLTKDLDLKNNIVFMGFVTEECLYRTLSASRIFVLPSRTEGWSIATAEALARGLPAVCYDIPAIRENYGECKSVFLVQAGNIQSFAERIKYLLSLSQRQYNALKRLSQGYVRRFVWHDVILRAHQALVNVTQSL